MKQQYAEIATLIFGFGRWDGDFWLTNSNRFTLKEVVSEYWKSKSKFVSNGN